MKFILTHISKLDLIHGIKSFTDFLRRISLITLALLIFVSTSGFKLSMHICENNLYDIGILTQAENCCMDVNHHHNMHCQDEKIPKNACENETVEFHKVDNFLNSIINVEFNSGEILGLFPVVTIDTKYFAETETINELVYINESPPLPISTNLSLLQTLLI